jgi:hypothetical protein
MNSVWSVGHEVVSPRADDAPASRNAASAQARTAQRPKADDRAALSSRERRKRRPPCLTLLSLPAINFTHHPVRSQFSPHSRRSHNAAGPPKSSVLAHNTESGIDAPAFRWRSPLQAFRTEPPPDADPVATAFRRQQPAATNMRTQVRSAALWLRPPKLRTRMRSKRFPGARTRPLQTPPFSPNGTSGPFSGQALGRGIRSSIARVWGLFAEQRRLARARDEPQNRRRGRGSSPRPPKQPRASRPADCCSRRRDPTTDPRRPWRSLSNAGGDQLRRSLRPQRPSRAGYPSATPASVAAGCCLRAERSSAPGRCLGGRVSASCAPAWSSKGQGRRWRASSARAGRARWR